MALQERQRLQIPHAVDVDNAVEMVALMLDDARRKPLGLDGEGPRLAVERPGDDHIELGWTDGRLQVDRGTEVAIELLCDHLVVALERIERSRARRESGKVIALRR